MKTFYKFLFLIGLVNSFSEIALGPALLPPPKEKESVETDRGDRRRDLSYGLRECLKILIPPQDYNIYWAVSQHCGLVWARFSFGTEFVYPPPTSPRSGREAL